MIYQGGYSLWPDGIGHIESGQRIYDPKVDGNVVPISIHFKFDMLPNRDERDNIQIHPDGHSDGTAGCTGIQDYNQAIRINFLMRNFRAIGIDVRNEPTNSWNNPN